MGLVPLTKHRYIIKKMFYNFRSFRFFTRTSARKLKTLQKKTMSIQDSENQPKPEQKS
jgi:hypothetical protein